MNRTSTCVRRRSVLWVISSLLGGWAALPAQAQCPGTLLPDQICTEVQANATGADIGVMVGDSWDEGDFDCDAGDTPDEVVVTGPGPGPGSRTLTYNVPNPGLVTQQIHLLRFELPFPAPPSPETVAAGAPVPFDIFASFGGGPEVELKEGMNSFGPIEIGVGTGPGPCLDDSVGCYISHASLDLGAETIALSGGFCPFPAVGVGSPGGSIVPVIVSDASDSAIEAGFPAGGPATILVIVDCPCEPCTIDVTVGEVGPTGVTGMVGTPGMPGEDGEDGGPGVTGVTGLTGITGATGKATKGAGLPLPQKCPQGQVVNGFTASGLLQCVDP